MADELSSIFISLSQTAQHNEPRIPLPQQITASRDWSLSCLARVITDRMNIDDNFIHQMINIWSVHPATRISPIARHTYLVDFVCEKEMYEVLQKEPWNYRSDIVSMKKVHEPAQLVPEYVDHVTLWTQFHNVPPEMLSAAGIYYLSNDIGIPVSEVRQGYNAGKLFMKTKINFKSEKALKDRMFVEHPTLGPLTIYLVYERVARLCSYCAKVGHEISGCPKRGRVLQLCADPTYANRPEMAFVRNHRIGPWINCPALVPRPLPPSANTSFNPNNYYPNPHPPHSPNPNPSYAPHPNQSNVQSPNPNQNHPYMPNPSTNQVTPTYDPSNSHVDPNMHNIINHGLIPHASTPYSNPNEASPLHTPNTSPGPAALTGPRTRTRQPRGVHSGKQLQVGAVSGSTSLPTKTRQLTINEEVNYHDNNSTGDGSSSPPPGYHKRLRAASRESPSGAQ